MTTVLTDRSFAHNLIGLLIASILLLWVVAVPAAQTSATALTGTQMTTIEGSGALGTALLGIGLTVAIVGVAMVATGGTVAIVAALASATTYIGPACTAINAGAYIAAGGLGVAAVGDYINSH